MFVPGLAERPHNSILGPKQGYFKGPLRPSSPALIGALAGGVCKAQFRPAEYWSLCYIRLREAKRLKRREAPDSVILTLQGSTSLLCGEGTHGNLSQDDFLLVAGCATR